MQKQNQLGVKWGCLGLFIVLFFWWPTESFAEGSTLEQRILALEKRNSADEDLRRAFSWLKKFKPLGDFRLRHASGFRKGSNPNPSQRFDRNRQRIRFRIGGEFFFTPNLKVGFRLASGEKSPTSTNQALDSSFSTKNINLDKAYVDWLIPRGNSSLRLKGGKFSVPFMKTQQVWDSDVTVEGIAEKLAHKFGNTQLELILGQFVVEEFSPSALDGATDDIHLLAYQGIVSQKLGDHSKAKVAVALYDYNDLRGNITSFGATGNTLDGNGRFQTNYDILNILAEIGTDAVMGVPVKLGGGYVQNISKDADNLENKGWEAGVRIGNKVKKFGDWQVQYFYRNTERDAVLSTFDHSDFHEGSTNSKGSELILHVGLYKGIKLALNYINSESITGPKTDLELFQADLILTLF
jgi:hypothetical protein